MPSPLRGLQRVRALLLAPIAGEAFVFQNKTALALLAAAAWAAEPAGALEIAQFSVAFHDPFPDAKYVADVGFDIDPRTPSDDEWIFGRGDAGTACCTPWVFERSSPASFSAFSNADDGNFDAVVAQLT